eukprot:544224-Pyramimonas_sp.AAC.1
MGGAGWRGGREVHLLGPKGSLFWALKDLLSSALAAPPIYRPPITRRPIPILSRTAGSWSGATLEHMTCTEVLSPPPAFLPWQESHGWGGSWSGGGLPNEVRADG